jgi:spore germination protein KA
MFKRTRSKPEPGETGSSTQTEPEISSAVLVRMFSDSPDIVFNDVVIDNKRILTVAFVDGLVDPQLVDQSVLKPLIQENALKEARSSKDLMEKILLGVVYHEKRTLRDKLSDCLRDLLSGSVALIFDDTHRAVTFEVKGFEKRSLTEPTNESVLKGSKEAFIEVLRVNTALIRRRMQTGDLVIYQTTIGRKSHTAVSVVYLRSVANDATVNGVKEQLGKIDMDAITSAGQIEAYLLNNRNSFFPQVLYTERVDKFCGNIAEGRVGILIDGLPITYIVPVDINTFLQAPEDYAQNYIVSSCFRLLRYSCAFVALTIPAIYVSITTFHYEMIPTRLAISIISSKQGVPFPTYAEVLLMLLAFEVLLEAGLRLPMSLGSAVSIVGALVVGQAAISANILSPGVVIIIAAAGIAGFAIPSQDMSNCIRICRLILVTLTIAGGLFTMTLGLIYILHHLCRLEGFGVPYMSPFVASEGKALFTDSIVRRAWFNLKKRPSSLDTKDVVRQK